MMARVRPREWMWQRNLRWGTTVVGGHPVMEQQTQRLQSDPQCHIRLRRHKKHHGVAQLHPISLPWTK